MTNQNLKRKLYSFFGKRLRLNEPLALYTTLGIGGPADYFLDISHEKELAEVLGLACRNKIPWTVLGFGSNVLISDTGIRGIVLRLGNGFKRLELERGIIHAGAAVRIQRFVAFAARHGYQGMECLIGVPGTLGGALIMNAGTRDGEISDYLQEVKILSTSNFQFQTLKKRDIEFGYRWSSLQESRSAIVSAKFKFLLARSKDVVLKKMADAMRRRKETQPIDAKNAGSIFKNPKGDHAARLIEAAGLKGMRMGDAMVSPKHANFIVNLGKAGSSDVYGLMKEIQKSVFKKFRVKLEPEIHLIGDFG